MLLVVAVIARGTIIVEATTYTRQLGYRVTAKATSTKWVN